MGRKSDYLNGSLGHHLPDKELESSLKDYPEDAEELRLLLKTAGLLRRYAKTIKPHPDFVARLEARLGKACELKYGPRQTVMANVLKPLGRWAVSGAIAVVMAFLTFAGGFALVEATAKNTVTGQALYSVKLATEKVMAVLVPANTERISPISPSDEIRFDKTLVASGGETDNVSTVLKGVEEPPLKLENSYQPIVNNDSESGFKNKSGMSETAPLLPPKQREDRGIGVKDKSGESGTALGKQPPVEKDKEAGVKNKSGKSEAAPGRSSSASSASRSNGKGKPGK